MNETIYLISENNKQNKNTRKLLKENVMIANFPSVFLSKSFVRKKRSCNDKTKT